MWLFKMKHLRLKQSAHLKSVMAETRESYENHRKMCDVNREE